MTTASTEESATPAAAKSSPTPWILLKSQHIFLLASPVSNLGYPAWGTLLCFGQRRGQSEDLARPPWTVVI